MIYTCYEMIRDCRADRAEGWRHFVTSYVPVIRKLMAHYHAEPAALERVLIAVHKPSATLFQSMEPSPERWFVAELRQTIVQALPPSAPAAALDLDTLAEALEPLTPTEKQVAWFESMLYTPAQTGVLLRMAPTTAEKIREKAANLIRGKVDTWSRTLLADNGLALGQAAVAAKGADCLTPKTFLDMLDGRTNWQGRGELERHVTKCWHCIDHFCRLTEVVEVLRGMQPLSQDEVAPLLKLIGVSMEKTPVWKRWLAGRA